MQRTRAFYWTLFRTTFTISAFTFGGGYVIVPLMRKKFVDQFGWLEEREMLDLTAIAQSAPGPIAVNASVLVGYRLAGLRGAFIAALATILPPFLLLSVISLVYTQVSESRAIRALLRGMQAGVAAVIVDVVITMARSVFKEGRWRAVCIMAGAFVAVAVFHINVLWILLVCAVLGAATALLAGRRKGDAA